jgi:hypothetical protein
MPGRVIPYSKQNTLTKRAERSSHLQRPTDIITLSPHFVALRTGLGDVNDSLRDKVKQASGNAFERALAVVGVISGPTESLQEGDVREAS